MVEVIWNKKANRARIAALVYGKEEFGIRTMNKLNERIEKDAERLALNPHLGSPEPLLADCKREFRSLVIHKHYKLVYWIDEPHNKLYIVDLWDTRREPSKLTNRIG